MVDVDRVASQKYIERVKRDEKGSDCEREHRKKVENRICEAFEDRLACLSKVGWANYYENCEKNGEDGEYDEEMHEDCV
jgi:hypothetical protein